MKYIIYSLCFFMPLFSFGMHPEQMDKLVSDFCKSTDTFKRLKDYHPNAKLSEDENIQFVFLSLDRLLDDPRWPDLTYGWKLSRLEGVICNIDPDMIPLKYGSVLFKALRSRTETFSDDIIFIDALERVTGNNPGYTIQYLEAGKFTNKERLDLIEKWENMFEQKKEHILKKRQYKNKYFGKKVAN